MKETYTLDISWETIIKIAFFGIFIYFLYTIWNLVVWFVFALIISILFEPLIKALQRIKFPRQLSTLFVYFFVFFILGIFLYKFVPFLISEVQTFSKRLPEVLPVFFEKVSPYFRPLGIEISETFQSILVTFGEKLQEMEKNLLSTISSIFGGVFAAIFTIIVAIFISLDENSIEKIIRIVVPKKYENYILNLWKITQQKVSGWFLIRIIGVIFVGTLSFISFKLIGVKYPVILATIGGTFDFIPILGPAIASILIFIMTVFSDISKAIFVFIIYAILQLLENYILFPLLSRKVIKISPILVIVALFIGGKIWGVLGAILAVPFVAILYEVLKEFLEKRKEAIFSSVDENRKNSYESEF